MSGKFLARASALSLAILLAACGGDDGSTPIVNVNTGQDSPSTGEGDTSPDTGTDGPDTGTGEPGQGGGADNDSPPPAISITASPTTITAGSASIITIFAMDADGNKVTDVDGTITLNSVCANSTGGGPAAMFTDSNPSTSEGSVFTTYTPTEACAILGTDTISARWKGSDTVKAEITVTVLTAPPTSDVAPNLTITAIPAEVIAGNSRRITVNATDADGNKVIGEGNRISLNSVCAASSGAAFDNRTLDISQGSVFTNYNPTEACIGTDTISVTWNNSDVREEFVIEVLEPQTPDLALGTYIGNVFLEGEIDVIDSLPLSNSGDESDKQTRLKVALYDKANNRIVEGDEFNINFYSSCSASGSGWASFEQASVVPETGEAKTIYKLGDDGNCTTSDTVYARLGDDYSIKAKVDIPIVDINVPEPMLKVGAFTGGSFSEGIITADPANLRIITGQPAPKTELRFALVDETDTPVFDSKSYTFRSMCIDSGRASVTNGTIESGRGIATYTASEDCLGTDTVSVVIDGDSDLRASVDLVVSKQELVVGSIDGAGFFNVGVLDITNTELGYNDNETTTTDILTAVALAEDDGSYTVLRGARVSLELFSTCTESGRSTISSTGSTESGALISQYTANECVGNDVVYARIQGGEELISNSVTISNQKGLDLQLGYFDPATNNFAPDLIGNDRTEALPPGVQTKLFLSIVEKSTSGATTKADRVKGQPLTVEFASQCGELLSADNSPLSTRTSTISLGYTEILYTAKGCGRLQEQEGEDTVTATLTIPDPSAPNGRSVITAEAKIALAPPSPNSLTSGLPTPNSIAPFSLSGTFGDRETTSVLEVQLKDEDKKGIPNKIIEFTLDNPANADVAVLSTNEGGTTATTDASGVATVNIKAKQGFDNTVFRVIARYTDTDADGNVLNILETYSAPIAVNSKLPYEDKFSISTSNFAPDTRGVNGVRVPLTLLAADDQGNRIRGNTIVNFETDIGSIEPECILDNEGRCNVTWESLDISNAAAVEYAEVRAYTQGTQATADPNAPTPTGEIDAPVRILMTTSEGISVSLDSNTIPADGGAFCAEASVDLEGTGASKYSPPVGTKMEFEVTNGTLLPSSSSSYTLGSSSALLTTPYSFTGCTFIEPDPDRSPELMKLTVTVTPPGGTSAFDRASE